MARQLDYHTIREIFTRFHIAEPEPRSDVISAPPVGRSLFRD